MSAGYGGVGIILVVFVLLVIISCTGILFPYSGV